MLIHVGLLTSFSMKFIFKLKWTKSYRTYAVVVFFCPSSKFNMLCRRDVMLGHYLGHTIKQQYVLGDMLLSGSVIQALIGLMLLITKCNTFRDWPEFTSEFRNFNMFSIQDRSLFLYSRFLTENMFVKFCFVCGKEKSYVS